ncbi:alpha/beta fold hydrolase [Noviherbaspirillum aerium]|uniref:alpha/beta fold hydrolase n=1 Tax=Noviherbaspirillum aerium TaxID=2588497 RepID=UPI001CEF829D|nr:alpha/beta fold hydrolase [Noviherbaspirillum aerium]
MAAINSLQSEVTFSSAAEVAQYLDSLDELSQRYVSQFEGRRMVWRRFGDGPSLVLLHGGHGSWLHWVRNIEALAARSSVWVPDLPGYGDSDAAASAELAAMVEQAIAGLDSLLGEKRKIDLVGFSFGGLVATQIAARRGQVRRLALLGAAGHGGPRRPRGKLLAWRDAAEAQDQTRLSATMRHNLAMHMLHDASRIDLLATQVHTNACIQARFRSKELSRAGGLCAALEQVDARVLAIWGEHDVTADPEAAIHILTEVCPDIQTHIVPGAGHWVQYDSANEVNHLLLAWQDQ